ncbi:MAG: phospho-sugar mutase [SAR324 cluster bacterium]|nr:phospho-sugar mutase [SAR324 cluster bacterium]
MPNNWHETAKFWSQNTGFDEHTRKEIQKLFAQNNDKELEDRFRGILEFGTGGLRGLMGAGTNRMNTYTVRQATEGLARYIKQQGPSPYQGVVLGYDSRHNSQLFAKNAAEVLAFHKIPVFIFSDIIPTPMVSCELLHRKAMAGIIITASHNPPAYNGYKVYWNNGGQIIPPDDSRIIEEVRSVEALEKIQILPFETGISEGLIQWVEQDADEYYFEQVQQLALGNPALNQKTHVIYTPLHGTGGRGVVPLLKRRGFEHLRIVPEQAVPDGNFSTVTSPNPEEESAMELAIAFSKPDDELILANDPDADRLGVMIRDNNQQWFRLNGNQIGALLLDYQLSSLKALNRMPHDGCFIVSLVTSPLGSSIARNYGLKVVETLTGFKWIWGEAYRLKQSGQATLVFGMEESHGYLAGTYTGDKDGVWAAMAFAEMTASLKAQGKTVMDALEQLYQQYGYHLDALETQTLPGQDGAARIQNVMRTFREQPPLTIAGKQVIAVTDLLNDSFRKMAETQIQNGPGLPKSNVLVFELEDQTRVIVRPSGTEPKIKFYFNLKGTDRQALETHLTAIKTELFAMI